MNLIAVANVVGKHRDETWISEKGQTTLDKRVKFPTHIGLVGGLCPKPGF